MNSPASTQPPAINKAKLERIACAVHAYIMEILIKLVGISCDNFKEKNSEKTWIKALIKVILPNSQNLNELTNERWCL